MNNLNVSHEFTVCVWKVQNSRRRRRFTKQTAVCSRARAVEVTAVIVLLKAHYAGFERLNDSWLFSLSAL